MSGANGSFLGGKTALQSVTIRGALIVLVSQLLALLKFTVDVEMLDAIADWVFAAVALVGGAISLWGRLNATRKITSGDGGDGQSGSALRALLLMGCLTLFCAAGAGCAKSPTARWAQARDGLSLAQNEIRTAHTAGAIGDADFVALDPFAQAVRGAIKKAEADLPAGKGSFDFYMDLAEQVLLQLTNPVPQPRSKDKEARNGRATGPVSAGSRDSSGWRGAGRVHHSAGGAVASAGRVHGGTGGGDPVRRGDLRLGVG
ncbi:MAG: hypothetical protein WBD40_01395 [Tepidisphaeraceae bacterium]